jgi:AcrR family transcriptional regulator
MAQRFKQRARGEHARDEKREFILKHARKLLDESQHDLPSVSRIMSSAKISKGTFYLYFNTKEEVYLELLKRGYRLWMESISESLNQEGISVEQLVKNYANFCAQNTEVLFLSSLSTSILEKNISEPVAFEFKKWVQAEVILAGRKISHKLKIAESEARRLYIFSYSLSVGIWNHCHPPEIIKRVYRKRELAGMRMDFESNLAAALQALWIGTLRTDNGGSM